MKYNFSKYEILRYYEDKKKFYFASILFLILGIIVGVIIVTSSDRAISLLKTEDKVLFDYINGKATFSKQFFRLFSKFLYPFIIIFLLGLSCFTNFLSYIYFAYLGALFFLNSYALIVEFSFSGILCFVLLLLPINLVLIVSHIFFQEICFSRCLESKKYKRFSYGFNQIFFVKIFLVIAFSALFSVVATLVLSLVLKNYIFMIF